MFATIQTDKHSNTLSLPEDDRAAHWLVDAEGTSIALAEVRGDGWLVAPGEGFSFARQVSVDADGRHKIPFGETDIFSLVAVSGGVASDDAASGDVTVLCRPTTKGDKLSRIIGFSRNAQLSIGRDLSNDIVCASRFMSAHHAVLSYNDGMFSIRDCGSANGVYVDSVRLEPNASRVLHAGQVVSILGLRIAVGRGFVSLNNPQNSLTIKSNPAFVEYHQPDEGLDRHTPVQRKPYFYPALRFARFIERKDFVIDAPPQREHEDDTPISMRIGPSLAMAMASILSAAVSVVLIMEQGSNMMRAIPMVAMAVAMLAGSVLWPFFDKRFQKKKYVQKELQRRGAYSQYLGKMRSRLSQEEKNQEDILRENRIVAQECLLHARQADSFLMSRIPLHKNYLELRIGRGEEPLLADIRFPDDHFNVAEDELRDVVEAFSNEPHVLNDVPLGYSLIENPLLGIVGTPDAINAFARVLVVQIAALHAYTDVKIVVFCDESQRDAWRYVSYLPHCFSDDKSMRFFAGTLDAANALGMFLEKELEARKSVERGFDAREAKPYYVVFAPSKQIYDKAGIVQSLLKLKDNKGFSLIACAEEMHQLPKQCRMVLGLGGGFGTGPGYLLNRDDPTGTRKPVELDAPIADDDLDAFVRDITSVKLDIADAKSKIPDRLGFLQMLGVSNADHLNIATRWRENNAADSLAAVVGIDAAGDPLMLDLHEDFHGPHGLIAGTTGSGKSEFIITYILSMAINYSPDDVSFVLIDYKGGGLAKAFDNDRFRLPHVAGTITNLDGAAITRSLASVKSELQRRQRLFNETRELVGGDNIDIYKYLDLFRQGRVAEPCPHLIIVADEFAELKQQEPEFMDELISAARIGRSLGVHLVLATQKPSGVVNDQIWSNSRFKVCLKVADAADSQEMLRRPDAAEITQAGRFYLMVGYNELFAMGQSGYTGVPYNPAAGKRHNGASGSVEYISDSGRVLLSVKQRQAAQAQNLGPELTVLMERLMEVADAQDKHARQLWLDPIPAHIELAAIERRFGVRTGTAGVAPESHDLNAVVGMYDNPAMQKQGMLSIPLSQAGNVVVYGSAESGSEQVLRAMVFSLLQAHSARTLSMYLLDFGSQALTAFAHAPQVGDVMLVSDEEKVRRFFDFATAEIARRRALLAPYGGSFERYCEKTDGFPAMVVMINGISAFLEAYSKYEEALIAFARDAAQVGIRLVITAEGANVVRTRLRSSFRQVLACDLADPNDYMMLFGSMRGVPLPHGYGRGLVKTDDGLLEFQAAALCPAAESEYDCIVAECDAMAQAARAVAPAIPMPPKRVDARTLAAAQLPGAAVPYGIYDDTLGVAAFDFDEAPLARCCFQKKNYGREFISAFLDAAILRGGWDVVLLDFEGMLGKAPAGVRAPQKDAASAYLQELAQRGADAAQAGRMLVVAVGLPAFLGGADFSIASGVKDYLKSLRAGGAVSFLLADTAVDAAGAAYDDWFKTHLSNKEGLWIGPGADAQNAISAPYNARFAKDSQMDETKGYAIGGGAVRLVHLVAATPDVAYGPDKLVTSHER